MTKYILNKQKMMQKAPSPLEMEQTPLMLNYLQLSYRKEN